MARLIDHAAMLVRRARFYVHRARFERELAEEMRFHVEMKARDNERDGMSADDARWAARRRFGNSTRLQEQAGDIMAVRWIDGALQDARYALRSLRKAPAFSAVAIASVALGIGATAAVFTLVNAMLLRPLPFPDGERLVLTFQTISPGVLFPVDSMPWSYQKFTRLRAAVPAFADAGFSSWEEYNLRRTGPSAGAQPAERVRAELVSTNLFSTLGARAMLGRVIMPADSVRASSNVVAVLSEPLWRREFGGDPGVIGTTAMLDRFPVTIVGVMPASFTGIRERAEIWVPLLALSALESPRRRQQLEGGMGAVVARLTPGASIAAADAQVKVAARAINAEIPPPSFGPRKAEWSGGLVSFAEARRHPLVRPLLLVLSVAVASVMLIVCANIAGLLLARARAREAEMGVRVALGAGRGRLARQVMTESLVLAVLGAVPGILLAYAGAAALARLRPTLPPNYVLLRSVDLLQGVSLVPDWRVLTFVVVLTAIVGALFGAAPAFVASRTNVAELIKVAGSRGGAASARGRRALVIGQVALATMLLVGAGLMTRSFRSLITSDIGFQPDGILKVRIAGGDSASATVARRAEMLTRIGGLPGVETVASYNCAPFGSDCALMPVSSVDARVVERAEYPPMEVHVVSREFLRALQIPLRLGRPFDSREPEGRVTAAIVNESAAKLLWPGQSPIGRRLSTWRDSTPPAEIIGVVADVKYEAIDGPARPAVYYDVAQWNGGSGVLVLRTNGDPASVLPALRRVVAETDPTIAMHDVETGTQMLTRAASSTRFITLLLTMFAVGAGLLAALGVYGVLAYLVSQRRREFGIRMAIGAQPSSVMALVVRQGVVLTIVGLVLGVGGAALASSALSSFLFGVARADVPTYASIILLVGIAGVLAAVLPARRATRVDPVAALRE